MSIKTTKKNIIQGIIVFIISLISVYLFNGLAKNGTTLLLLLWAVAMGLVTTFKVTIDKKIYKNIILYSMFSIGVILWGIMLFNSNVWYDEGYTIGLISQKLPSLIEITSKDVHSPLYYLIAKFFYIISGNHIQGAKLCSYLFTIAYLLLGLFPIRKEFGNRISFCFLALSVFSPCMIWHSTDIRMYSMSLFAFTLLCLFAIKFYREPKIKYIIPFFLASVFCVYIHTFTMISTVILYLIMAILFIIKKYETKKNKLFAWISFIVNSILVSLAYLPWLLVLMNQFKDRVDGSDQLGETTLYSLMDYLAEWFSNIYNPGILSIVVFSFLFILLCLQFAKVDAKVKNISLIGLFIFLSTVLIGYYISVTNVTVFIGRYAFSALGLLIFFMAVNLASIKDNRIILLIVLICGILSIISYRDYYKLYHNNSGFNTFKQFMEINVSKENDVIIFNSQHTQYLSIYYPDYNYFIFGHKAPLNPFENSEAFKDYSQLEPYKGNIYYVTLDDKYNEEFALKYNANLKFGFDYMFYHFSIFELSQK